MKLSIIIILLTISCLASCTAQVHLVRRSYNPSGGVINISPPNYDNDSKAIAEISRIVQTTCGKDLGGKKVSESSKAKAYGYDQYGNEKSLYYTEIIFRCNASKKTRPAALPIEKSFQF